MRSKLEASSLRGQLNSAQYEAVTTHLGPLLVLAGAGTGKTRVITFRIASLLHEGVDPSSILAVTFTNKAAKEMKERVKELLGFHPKGITISTFHSLGVRILRTDSEALGLRTNFTIYDSSDQQSLLRGILRDIRGAVTSSDVRSVQSAISLAKNRFQDSDDLIDEAEDDWEILIARAFARYEEHLFSMNAVDFDDLIRLPVKLFKNNSEIRDKYQGQFRFVMVDEYQDTNGSQYRFTQSLVGAERNICVVGDDDQSIYGFRGAEMDKILKFERDFPGAKVIKLEENYRSTASILSLANRVISENSERYPKELKSTLGVGEPIEWVDTKDEPSEVDYVLRKISEIKRTTKARYEDFVILMRSAFQARPFEEKLRLRQIPYTLVGGQSYYDRKEIKDVLGYWNVLSNPHDDVSFLRIVNTPKRGIGPTAIKKLDTFARSKNISVYESIFFASQGQGDFPPRMRASLKLLAEAFAKARDFKEEEDYGQMCRTLLDEICYKEYLHELYPDPLTVQSRWAAVEELCRGVEKWQEDNPGQSFSRYMEALMLQTQDEQADDDRRGVTLMTLHSAKGLEFPVAFLVGTEEEILPHKKSIEQGDRAVEEERRLLYVGITRAQRRLFIVGAKERKVYGATRVRLPSRFLTEIGDFEHWVKEYYDPDAQVVTGDQTNFFLNQILQQGNQDQ